MTNSAKAVVIVVLVANVFAEIILQERKTIWNPGVPGGIPLIANPVENVIQHGADLTGTRDCKDAITSAINALPEEGGVVYLPEGKYLIRSTITIGNNNVVIRGDGADKTRLLNDHTGLCFEVITYKRGAWQKCISGFTKDSKVLSVEDGSKFSVGAFAEMRQANDSTLMYTNPEWIQSWADSAVGQLFEITEINGNTLSFRNAVHFDFRADLSPQIRPQGFVTAVGFESLYIERLQTGGSTFMFKNTAYCWIRNVESNHTRNSHVTNNTTIGCEYRDSYFHNSFSYGGGGSGYGVEFGYHSTDGLVENNVFDSLRHAMMVHVGTSGTVFGYNYSANPVQGDGEINLNNGWVPPDISLHGHYAQMNLFESNVVQEIGVGDYWGPMGPGNTFLRNVVQGEGMFLYDHSSKQNFVGNVTTLWKDDGTSKQILRHGEQVNGVTFWDSAITDRAIPTSYYLQSKPDFYGTMGWPSVGLDKPDGTIPSWERRKSGKMTSEILENKIRSNKKLHVSIRKGIGEQKFYLNVESYLKDDIQVKIFDLSGKIIPTKVHILNGSAKYSVEVEKRQLSGGVYFLHLYYGGEVAGEKVVVGR